MYPILAAVFFLTLIICFMLIAGFLAKPKIWQSNLYKIKIFCCVWFIPYLIFILFFTGPKDLSKYSLSESSEYKLPWKANLTRFVSQGNRSFTSHRGLHLYAWDFWMAIGTEVLAARDGKVVGVEDRFDGIGPNSNYITIEHKDGTHALYAHIKHFGAIAKIGMNVKQGQLIAYSGMVGQTVNPHLHFVVLNK
ncbi:MAG: M23 family metallopeptidase, partial [Bdellovibrionales bacterium]|nr:M23 family metallopeptidase [Bdellovibrionales bacterium]